MLSEPQMLLLHSKRCNPYHQPSSLQVTTIADALLLHRALEAKKEGKWDRVTDEEYEDADGNVYNKKTYEDLRKQGLI